MEHPARGWHIDRATEVVTWNIVPWYVGDGTRIRAVTEADRQEARPALAEFLALVPQVRVVVVLGRAAAEMARRRPASPPGDRGAASEPAGAERPSAARKRSSPRFAARSVAGLAPAAPSGATPAASWSRCLPGSPRGGHGPAPPRPRSRRAGIDRLTAEAVVRAYEGERLRLQAIGARFDLTTQEVERLLWEWEPRVYPRLRLEPEPGRSWRPGMARSPIAPPRSGQPRLRWERIAHRSGVSGAEARRLYERVKVTARPWVATPAGGRRFEGMEP